MIHCICLHCNINVRMSPTKWVGKVERHLIKIILQLSRRCRWWWNNVGPESAWSTSVPLVYPLGPHSFIPDSLEQGAKKSWSMLATSEFYSFLPRKLILLVPWGPTGWRRPMLFTVEARLLIWLADVDSLFFFWSRFRNKSVTKMW